jgi:hypothetical protein
MPYLGIPEHDLGSVISNDVHSTPIGTPWHPNSTHPVSHIRFHAPGNRSPGEGESLLAVK